MWSIKKITLLLQTRLYILMIFLNMKILIKFWLSMSIFNGGTILECKTEEIDYVGIKMLGSKNQEVIRIRKEFYEIIKCPQFNIGDKVKIN